MSCVSGCGVVYTPQFAMPLGSQCGPDVAGSDEYGSVPQFGSPCGAPLQSVPTATWVVPSSGC